VLVACVAAAAAIRLVLAGLERPLRLETPLTRATPQTRIALGVAAGAIAIAAVAVVAGGRIATAWNEFFYGPPAFQGGQERLGSASGGGRTELWDVGMTAFAEHPLTGTGAGTWALEWRREGIPGLIAENAHSLYVEVMSDLGLVGLLLLAVALALILVGFAARIRGPSRSLYAALLAAAVAWGVHNAVDWDWELPATTIWLFALGGAALAAAPPRRTTRSFFSAAYTGRLHLNRQGILRVAVALACFALAIVPARVTASQLRLDRAVARYQADDCRRAQAHANSALAAAWWRTEALTILAYCAIERGDGEAAVGAARRALAADPDHPELSFAYATALAADGRDPTEAATRALRGQRRNTLLEQWRDRFAAAGSPAELRSLARRAPRIDVDPGTPSRTSIERPPPRPGPARPIPPGGAPLRPPGGPRPPIPGRPRQPGQPPSVRPGQPVGPGGVAPRRPPAPGQPVAPSRRPAPQQLPPQQLPPQP
jgi:hypothetical protein